MSILEAVKEAIQAVARVATTIFNAIRATVTDLAESIGWDPRSAVASVGRGFVEIAWWSVVLFGGFTLFNLITSSATYLGVTALVLGGFWVIKEIALEKPQTVLAVAS
jgi:hypothetical protein